MTAVLFLATDGMLAKDGMKRSGFRPVFLEHVPTGGADMRYVVNPERVLCEKDSLHLCQQG